MSNFEIRFKRDFIKFKAGDVKSGTIVRLLQVLKVEKKELNRLMMEYDGTWVDSKSSGMWFLPDGPQLFMVFRIKQFQPLIFTTIRPYTEERYRWYKNHEGEWFEVIIESDTDQRDVSKTEKDENKSQRGLGDYLSGQQQDGSDVGAFL